MECFKDWCECKNTETWEKYKIDKKETKKLVSEASDLDQVKLPNGRERQGTWIK